MPGWLDRFRYGTTPVNIALNLDLANARADLQVSLEAAGLLVDRLDGYLTVKVNSPNGDAINLRHITQLRYPFKALYFTNTAQAGSLARLILLGSGLKAHARALIGSISKYLTPTALGAAGTAAVWTPSTTNSVLLKRIQLTTDTATRLDLLWTTTAWESYYLPANGSIIINYVGTVEVGPLGSALQVKSSAAATVSAHASGEEI
jgi:hypothetical protein